MTHVEELRALAPVYALRPGPVASGSPLPAAQGLQALGGHHVTGEAVRVADHGVRPGAVADEGGAVHGTGPQDLHSTLHSVRSTTATLASSTAHLARALRGAPSLPA